MSLDGLAAALEAGRRIDDERAWQNALNQRDNTIWELNETINNLVNDRDGWRNYARQLEGRLTSTQETLADRRQYLSDMRYELRDTKEELLEMRQALPRTKGEVAALRTRLEKLPNTSAAAEDAANIVRMSLAFLKQQAPGLVLPYLITAVRQSITNDYLHITRSEQIQALARNLHRAIPTLEKLNMALRPWDSKDLVQHLRDSISRIYGCNAEDPAKILPNIVGTDSLPHAQLNLLSALEDQSRLKTPTPEKIPLDLASQELAEIRKTKDPFRAYDFARRVDAPPGIITEMQQIIIGYCLQKKEAYLLYLFARDVPGADVAAIQKIVNEWGRYPDVMLFGRDIEGANLRAIEKELSGLPADEGYYTLPFALHVKGMDVKLLQGVMLKYLEKNKNQFAAGAGYSFAVNVEGANVEAFYAAIDRKHLTSDQLQTLDNKLKWYRLQQEPFESQLPYMHEEADATGPAETSPAGPEDENAEESRLSA
ncbi:hypothetical protein [Desulfuromonas thiophila]|uniref:Uncharacterized protein n=1 Tax=Desulfuromonas thiophila TaxID=57664 RepID=A0A1G7ALY8_9BACT|nr:hypothetical protein [Desulfuromonas thiophila]SDE15753.1 hypothetical protein SAMN05661003_104112 [Desulfuromonas thiophila]